MIAVIADWNLQKCLHAAIFN